MRTTTTVNGTSGFLCAARIKFPTVFYLVQSGVLEITASVKLDGREIPVEVEVDVLEWDRSQQQTLGIGPTTVLP